MSGPEMKLAYADYVQDGVFNYSGYASSTPGLVGSLDSLQTIQLSDCSVFTSGLNNIKNIWAPLTEDARTISVISILDVRFVEFMDQLEVWYYDNALAEQNLGDFAGYEFRPSINFIRNVHIFLPTPVLARGIRVQTYRDAEHSIGRLWAGPVWAQPSNVVMSPFESDVLDPGEMPTSRGAQGYPVKRQKRRYADFGLNQLTFEQAYGNDAETIMDIQQLKFSLGTTEPCIVFPRTQTNAGAEDLHAIHRLGTYGHLTPDSLRLRDAGGGTFSTKITATELL